MARIGITMGDPSGIGPEIAIKAVHKLRSELSNLTIIGSVSILTAVQIMLKINFPKANVIDTPDIEFEFGKVQRSSGQAALSAIQKGVTLVKAGKLDALVTAPVNKKAIQLFDPSFRGHTELLAAEFGVHEVIMIAHSPYASFAFVTTHHALRDVSGLVNVELVLRKIELYEEFLETLHERPARIAVLGLNPHCGEFSYGEEEKIAEAIRLAREKGMDVEGPYPADTFHRYMEQMDGFLVQYHDQGMIPAKLLSRGEGVNVTWGLGFVRTSPLHGTAFDIAGNGEADPLSMVAAIRMAAKLAEKN